MPTGAAAEQAAQNKTTKPATRDDDRGPGSVAGNLTADPELRYTNEGTAVANLRVAVTERVQDPKTHEWKDGPTAFYDIQAWRRLAENACEYLERGARIVAEGRWRANHWEDKEGNIQERIVLVARDLGPSLAYRGARLEPREKRNG